MLAVYDFMEWFLLSLLLIFIGVYLIYNVVLFWVYSKVIQLYIHINLLFSRFSSHTDCYRILSRIPELYNKSCCFPDKF